MIYWFPEEESGKKELPPEGEYYYPIIILEDGSSWSFIIRLLDRVDTAPNERISNCEVCFMFEQAPQHLLRNSAEFILYEGPYKVAAMVIRE